MFKGINVSSLLLIFLIVALLFGTKRLREIGNDLGAAIKNFRKGMQGSDEGEASKQEKEDAH